MKKRLISSILIGVMALSLAACGGSSSSSSGNSASGEASTAADAAGESETAAETAGESGTDVETSGEEAAAGTDMIEKLSVVDGELPESMTNADFLEILKRLNGEAAEIPVEGVDMNAGLTAGSFMLLMDRTMGYVTAEENPGYQDLVSAAEKGGLLKDITVPEKEEDAPEAAMIKAVLNNALTAVWYLSGDEASVRAKDTGHLTPTILHQVFKMTEDGRTLEKEQLMIGEVPAALTYVDSEEKKPVVMLFHPITENKTDYWMTIMADSLAEQGYFCVAIDAQQHGDLAGENPNIWAADRFTTTPEHADQVLDYIGENYEQADVDRLGMAGFSLGGMNILYYLAHGTHKVSAVGNFHGILYVGPVMDAEGNPEEDLPLVDIEKMLPVALLLMCGDADEWSTPSIAEDMYQDLLDHGAEHVELIMEPGQGHWCTQKELDKTIELFAEFL